MTALANSLLREVMEAGGTVRLEGDTLRLSAPQPLPDELRARLRQHKAELVALLSAAKAANDVASIVQSVGGLPREVDDGVHAILSADGAQGIPPQRWPRVQGDAARLVEGGWARKALAFGWTATDLFGCDRRAPWRRLDRAGLVLLTAGHEIVELSADDAALRTSTGSVRYRRRLPARPPVALLWELLISARATGPPMRGPTTHPSEERMAATYLAGPAAILTRTIHEGTIMAASTLRALRSDASAISTWVRPRRCGASP